MIMGKVVLFCLQLWLAKLALANEYDDATLQDPSWVLFNTVPCGSVTCSLTTEDCIDDQFCLCKPDFEYREGHCHICPGEGSACSGCCLGEATCSSGRCQRCWKDQNGKCLQQDSLFFLTAAQVALATAMVIGVSALATLMYKTFRGRSRNNRQQILESELHRDGSSRISLSSLQIRVLRRLRDRPPKYETRHNYEFHQRENNDVAATGDPRPNTTPVSEEGRTAPVIGAPPPAYDGDVTSLVDFPPPYSADLPHPKARVAIVDEQRSTETRPEENATDRGQTDRDAGIVNEAFDHTEGTNAKIEDSASIDIVSNGEHKTLHI